jgi:hypothetical protein
MAVLVPLFTSIATAAGSALTAGAAATGTASLGTVLTVGSTLLGAVGSIQQGQAANKAAQYNAEVQEIQARVAQDQGAARATELSQRTKQRLAATRAASMESGLELSGSVNDVLDTVQKQGALDEITALYDSNVRAQGLRQSAAAERVKGRNTLTASYFDTGTSILTGFSKAYQG